MKYLHIVITSVHLRDIHISVREYVECHFDDCIRIMYEERYC